MSTTLRSTPRKSTRPAPRPSPAASPAGPPVAPRREASRRRPFAEGLLASMPNYRLDCTIEDLAFWEEESRREEDRMFDRLYEEVRAQDRLEMGLEPW